jgi:hypothetical protein
MFCFVLAEGRVEIIRLIVCVRFATEPKIQSTSGIVNAFKFILTAKVQNNILYAQHYSKNVIQFISKG